MTARIVVVGSFNADLTSYMARMPQPGETVSGDAFTTGPGGKGSNQAVAAARLGAEVTFIGRVGQDVFSTLAFELWEREGINSEYVVRDPELATGVAQIFVDEGGENSIVVVLGANLALTTEDIDVARHAISQSDLLLAQLEIEQDIVRHALEVARGSGLKTILNPAPASPLPPELLELVDILTPIETELNQMHRKPGARIAQKARDLLGREDQAVIVTRGADGAQVIRTHDSRAIPAFPVQAVDTTGAGDAFNGGLALALAEGRSLPEAVTFANAVAALCVTKPGAALSMPTREEVEALLQGG
jgi:ribokinase